MSTSTDLIDTKRLSEEEKRQYYTDWVSSGLRKTDFCRAHRLPVDTLHYWHKKYKTLKVHQERFSEVMVKRETIETSYESTVDVGIKLPNAVQFQATLSTQQMVNLIRGLCDAPSTVW
jgi:hypothetical protein